MFVVFAIMIGGILIGLLLRKVSLLQKLNRTILLTIYLLLFLLGISVGSNEQIVRNLSSLGLEALALSLAGCFGSAIAAWIVYHFAFKERRR